MALTVTKTFGATIKRARIAAKFPTANAAAVALKMSSTQYHRLEGLESAPGFQIQTVARLCSAFPGLKPSDFFTVSK